VSAVRDVTANRVPDLDLSAPARICETAPLAAREGDTALVWVNVVCQLPGAVSGAVHDVALVPAWTADGGATWTWANPFLALRSNPSPEPAYDQVSSFGLVPLSAGRSYTFAAELRERFGPGFRTSSCYCRTMVEVIANEGGGHVAKR
jgi:hypothetical protein